MKLWHTVELPILCVFPMQSNLVPYISASTYHYCMLELKCVHVHKPTAALYLFQLYGSVLWDTLSSGAFLGNSAVITRCVRNRQLPHCIHGSWLATSDRFSTSVSSLPLVTIFPFDRKLGTNAARKSRFCLNKSKFFFY